MLGQEPDGSCSSDTVGPLNKLPKTRMSLEVKLDEQKGMVSGMCSSPWLPVL